MSRRTWRIQKRLKKCPECLTEYHPFHKAQVCCSKVCAGIRNHRRNPKQRTHILGAQARKREIFYGRLNEQIKGMDPIEIWKLGRKSGIQFTWDRMVRRRQFADAMARRSADMKESA